MVKHRFGHVNRTVQVLRSSLTRFNHRIVRHSLLLSLSSESCLTALFSPLSAIHGRIASTQSLCPAIAEHYARSDVA